MNRLQSAAVVASVAQLNEVRLANLSSEVNLEPEDVLDRECSLHIQTNTSHRYDEKSAVLSVCVGASVVIREAKTAEADEASEAGRLVLSLDAAFHLSYQLPSEAPPKDVREDLFSSFAALNGVYNAWPYLRELVQNVTGRMGFPSVLIPLYRVPRTEEEAEQGQAQPKLKLVAGGE